MEGDLMYRDYITKDNINEVLISLIKLTDKITDEKLDKIENRLKDFFNYQKYEVFSELLIKKNQGEAYEERVLDMLFKTMDESDGFNREYIKNLLKENKDIFTKKFSLFISWLNNNGNLFGEIMGVSKNSDDIQPRLVRGESLKNGLICLLQDKKNRDIFIETADGSYRYKILNFLMYSNPNILKELENEINQDGIWEEILYREKNKIKKLKYKINYKNIHNFKELRAYIFKLKIDNMNTDFDINYTEIYEDNKRLIFRDLAKIDFELYHRFLTSLDSSDKLELIKKSLEIDFDDKSLLGLLSSQFNSEDKNINFEEDMINKFYKKYEEYCLKKEVKEKNPGEGIYNEIDILVELYFNFNEKLFDSNLKKEALKDKYLNYYSYYLGILGKEKDFVNLDRIDYTNLFRGLIYNKNNLKNKVLNEIEKIESKLLKFLECCTFRDSYRTKYYLNFLLEKKVEFDQLYSKDNINILKEIAIQKKDRNLLSKILKNNTGLEYDRELFGFLFKFENSQNLKSIVMNIYKSSSKLRVVLFKDELENLVEELLDPELKVLFLLWLILKVENILLKIEAINIMEREAYEDIEISKEMIESFNINDYLDRKGRVEVEVLKKRVTNPDIHFWNVD